MIEAVFFDGDQTLWDFQMLMRQALGRTLGELRRLRPCVATSQLDVEDMIIDRGAVAARLHAIDASLEAVRHAAFVATLDRIGLPDADLAEHLNEYYLRWRFTDVPLYPDVVPALTVLGSRYRLGLLSNGNGYPERSGLGGVFQAVVFSQDHAVDKPDRRLFDTAGAQIGSRPDRLVMVGDSIRNDVQGARDAGWHGVWLNRDQLPPPEPLPTHSISSLDQLPALIETFA